MGRPILRKNLDSNIFQEYYYLKAELMQFCRQENLQATGSKKEIEKRIIHYLSTGEKLVNKKEIKRNAKINEITETTLIEQDFVCTQMHRTFFKQKIGFQFSFVVDFQKWLKSNAGKTYKDAIEMYSQIISEKKYGKNIIGEQFEYNTYIRDFFANNKGMTLNDAIKCWKYKKKLLGNNKYEKEDLIILQKN